MTLFSFTTSCHCLGVDPKTLRRWLHAASLACCPHPADARLTCLTLSQIEMLAQVHNRLLLLTPPPPHLLSLRALLCLLRPPPLTQIPLLTRNRSHSCSSRSPRCKPSSLNSCWPSIPLLFHRLLLLLWLLMRLLQASR